MIEMPFHLPVHPCPQPRWVVLLLLLVAMLPQSAYAFSCPHALAGGAQGHRVWEQAVLRDPGGRLTIEDIASPSLEASFTPLAGQLAAGYTPDVLWLRLCLPPPAMAGGQPRWLRISPALLDDLILYLPRGDAYLARQAGDIFPFTEREWPYHLFAFAIPSDTDIGRPAYLRVETSSAMNLHLDLWSEQEFRSLTIQESLFYGSFTGIAALLIGFSLFAWRQLHNTLYLYYALNVLAGTVAIMMNNGLLQQFFYPQAAGMNNAVIALISGPRLAVHVLFFSYLFALRRHLPRLYAFMLLLAAFYACLTPLGLLIDWRYVGMTVSATGIPVTLMWMALFVFIGWKDKERRIYVFAFLPMLISFFASALSYVGLVPESFLIIYGGEAAMLIHMIMLILMIIYRAGRAEQEKRLAQARELAQAHRVEKELEARVEERTEQLRQEIEQRSRLQEQLQEALAAEQAVLANQRELVAMLSHEFRTPLAIIDTVAQRLDTKLKDIRPDMLPRIGKIRRAVGHLMDLLENCLASERMNATEAVLHPKTLDMRQNLALSFTTQAWAGLPRIRFELPDQPVWVRCDPYLVDIALANLVSNALKYSPKDSPVTIRLFHDLQSDQVRIEVRDRGLGIQPEDRQWIFDKFFRGKASANVPGAGLGLHLARELIRRQGGDVVLGVQEDGQGCTFILTLPCARVGGS